MSLMSDTQGSPERVWSLVNLLAAHDGLKRDELKAWLDPFDTDPKGTALQQTVGAAMSLDFVASDRTSGVLHLAVEDPPGSILDFADHVHAKLVETPGEHANSIVFEAYSWFVAKAAKDGGTLWTQSMSTDDLVDQIRVDLTPEGEEGRFNKTRYPRWRDWIAFVGLGIELPHKVSKPLYPYVTTRMERELRALRKQFGTGNEISADGFIDALVRRMPYLDTGALFRSAASRIRWVPPSRNLSIVFSTALRDLDDDGALELKMYGDTRNAVTLRPDPTQRKSAFVSVVLKSEEARND